MIAFQGLGRHIGPILSSYGGGARAGDRWPGAGAGMGGARWVEASVGAGWGGQVV